MFLNTYITGFPPDINSAWQYVTGDLQPHIYQLTAAQPIDRMEEPDAVYYRPAVLLNHILTSPTLDRCLKTHHAKITMDGIPMIPPRLSRGALYIVRDPRDVAISFADHMGCTIDEAIDNMANNQMTIHKDNNSLYHVLLSWSSHVDSWTIQNTDVQTAVLRYEDLLDRPNKSWAQVLEALGLPIDQKKLVEAKERVEFARLQEQEVDSGFKEVGKGQKFFRSGKAGAWKELLTEEQVKQIEGNHKITMERWGYLKPAKKPNTIGKIRSSAVATVS